MRSPALLLAAALFLAIPAIAAGIEVNDAAGITLAIAISDAADVTTAKVGACIGDGGEHQDCLCAGKAEIAGVRAALDDALAVHPEWEGGTLFVADQGTVSR